MDKNATEAWYANVRAVNLLSCAGMVTSYLRKLSSVKAEPSHFAALDAAGIDPQCFREVVDNDTGLAYVMEV